jgi:hypothetical protein
MTFSFSRYDLVCLFSWAIGRGAQMFSNAFLAETAVEAALSNPSVSRGRFGRRLFLSGQGLFEISTRSFLILKNLGRIFRKKCDRITHEIVKQVTP